MGARAKAGKLDFDDEEAVLAEVCKELDIDPEDAEIEEDRGLTSFREGTVYTISVGRKEYAVAENEDAAHELAIAMVTQDLEEEPEIFNQSFIESHIDTKKLARELRSDVHSERYDYYEDLAESDPEEFWDEAERHDMEVPEAEVDEDGNEGDLPEPKSADVDKLADLATDELLKDPMEYLEDIYGKEDSLKQAIEIAGVDIEAAAKEAVAADGEGHFLSSYDGETHETKNGLVYWRTN